MKRTKHTALAFLLTLCMALGLLHALTVTASAADYTVTMNSMTNGSVTADKTSASQGDTVTLTVTPDADYELNALTITKPNGATVLTVSANVPGANFQMPSSNVTVSATFTKRAYGVNLGAASNGALTRSASSAQAGDSVTFTVTPDNGYELDALTVTRSDNGESVTVTETSSAGNVKTFSATMPASNVTATATFKKATYKVAVQSVDNGTVSVMRIERDGVVIGETDSDGNPTGDISHAQIGDKIILEVKSNVYPYYNPGYKLQNLYYRNLSTDNVSDVGMDEYGLYSFTMIAADVQIEPSFTTASAHNITVLDGIVNGTLQKLMDSAPAGDTVRMSVWSADGYALGTLTVKNLTTNAMVSVPPNTLYFTMPDANVEVGVTFVSSVQRNISVNSSNGTVLAKDSGGNQVTSIVGGSRVTLEVTPNAGTELTSLTVTGGAIIDFDVTASVFNFTMPAADVTVTAVFKQPQTITLSGGDSVELAYGDTANVGVSVQSSNGVSYAVTEGDDVVSVDASGNLTTLKAGTAVVRVTANENDNYAGATKDVYVTVTPKLLTVTANDQSKTEGDTDPALTYTATGFAGTDTAETVFTGALARDAGEAVGEYAITQGTLAPNANYVIAYYAGATLTITAAGPSYTVKAADTTTATDKKYHYGGEDITIAVTVSGADFEGGEFTLAYDSSTLDVKTFPTNNVITNDKQTAGTVKFEAATKTKITNGQPLATITFTVKTKVKTDTTCNFTFDGTPKICYDTGEDSVEAKTVTPGSVIVEPVTYTVTLTPNPSDLTLTGDNGVSTVDNGKAIDGQPYSVTIGAYNATEYEYAVTLTVAGTEGTTTLTPSATGIITVETAKVTGNLTISVTKTTKHVTPTLTVSPEGAFDLSGVTTISSDKTTNDAIKGLDYVVTIGGYDAANYTYAVTLTMNGASATAPTPDTTGKLTITGTDITGNFTLSVTRTLANFTVTTTADYVTGWTLVTVAKSSGRTDNPVYNYDSKPMYYVNAYGAYAYLVSGAVTVADATAKVTLGDTAAGTIAAGYDVNQTTKVDYSDTLLTYRCYEKAYETPATAMETYLRADVDASKKVDTTDVSEIDKNRTPESGS